MAVIFHLAFLARKQDPLLSALGVELRRNIEEWAVRFSIGWFTENTTGYEHVRMLPGGMRIRIDRDGIHKRRDDPIEQWVQPAAMARADALELGRESVKQVLRSAAELCHRPSVGLTGGRDSRAIVACMRSLGMDFRVRVRGAVENLDVHRRMLRLSMIVADTDPDESNPFFYVLEPVIDR